MPPITRRKIGNTIYRKVIYINKSHRRVYPEKVIIDSTKFSYIKNLLENLIHRRYLAYFFKIVNYFLCANFTDGRFLSNFVNEIGPIYIGMSYLIFLLIHKLKFLLLHNMREPPDNQLPLYKS